MKIMLLFPDGVGIRNYLYSDVFKGKEENLVLFHGFDAKAEQSIKEITAIKNSIAIPKYQESFKEKFLRELICLSRLKYNTKLVNNPTILTNWNTKHKGFKKQLFYKMIAIASIFISSYQKILKLESWYQKAIRKTDYYIQISQILKEIQPQKIFCSHQRTIQCATIFAAAKDLDIETITVIYSWDNLPKARMALRADKYLVWSDYMKEEMKQFYPEITSEDILVTGTPQFEFYTQEEKIIKKEEFANQYGLDVNRPWICFSGDDVKTSPYDPQYLQDVAQAVSQIEEHIRPQIIFRRCPVDFSTRYDTILNEFKECIVAIDPIWNVPDAIENWGVYFSKKEDITLQVNMAFHCAAVVNLGSTMAHDFAMFDKPCFYYNYDPVPDKNWSVKTIYNYQHFRSMKGLEAVGWLHSKEVIQTELEKVIKQEQVEGKDRKLWLQRIVLHPVNQASKNIAQILNN